MISILDVVVAKKDLDPEVKLGAKGTVLEIFDEGKAFLVEFLEDGRPDGKVLIVESGDVEIIWHANSTLC